jgi:hypothetical protein
MGGGGGGGTGPCAKDEAADSNISLGFEVFTAATTKDSVFWDIKIQFVPHEKTHYVSATELSQLMLCKI